MELVNDMRLCLNDDPGKIYADWEQDNYRCLVMRGPSSICGYIGVKPDHPYFGKDYSSLEHYIECHGGLTFAREGNGHWPEGYWWFGWDYAHYGDACFYELKEGRVNYDEFEYSPQDVYNEFPEVIEQFKAIK